MKRFFMTIALLCALLAAVGVFAPVAIAAQVENAVSASDVSGSDVSDSDIGNFERVPMVPLNVEIPEFYQEVVNVSGMYIFMLPDGTICKRIYGALDGVFGWYEPVGPDNVVYSGSKPIDVEDDIELYYSSGVESDLQSQYVQAYAGILAPEEGVSTVNTIFGISLGMIFICCAGGAVLLCMIILIGSRIAAAHRYKKNKDYNGLAQWRE